MADKNSTYEEIAAQSGLTGRNAERYIAYMRRRWGIPEDERVKCLVGYASEWATRFRTGLEYNYSDSEGLSVLRAIDGNVGTRDPKVNRF